MNLMEPKMSGVGASKSLEPMLFLLCHLLSGMLLVFLLYKFKELAQAYKVIGDPKKREIYDHFGEDALWEGMGGGSPFGGVSSRGRRHRRGEDVIHLLNVYLEEMYLGTTKKLSLSRNALC